MTALWPARTNQINMVACRYNCLLTNVGLYASDTAYRGRLSGVRLARFVGRQRLENDLFKTLNLHEFKRFCGKSIGIDYR